MARATNSKRPRRRPAMRRKSAYLSRSVVCTIGGVTEHQLLLWEAEELVKPVALVRVEARPEPVYDHAVLRRIRTIRALSEELGVNLAGIGVILHLLDRLSGQGG